MDFAGGRIDFARNGPVGVDEESGDSSSDSGSADFGEVGGAFFLGFCRFDIVELGLDEGVLVDFNDAIGMIA